MPSIKPLTPESSPSSELWDYLQAGTPQDIDTTPTDIIQHYSGLRLGRKTVSWDGRDWLRTLLTDQSKTIAVLKSRQVGWTVILAALMSYYALSIPGIEMIYCTMRQEAMRYFSKSRLKPFFRDQGISINTGDDRIRSFQLHNESQIILISGHDDFAQARGYSPDMVFLDECEALPLQSLGVIQEAMAASDIGRMYLGGTGGMEGSVWEKYWHATTKQVWRDGAWIPQNDNATISGYHITQRMLPDWTQEAEDAKRNDPGSTPATFDMEVLGVFTAGLKTPLPLSVVRSCMKPAAWEKPGKPCIAAIDLAGGGESDTVIVVVSPDLTQVMYAESIRDARVADIFPKIKDTLDRYNPTDIITDAGGNHELKYAISDAYECMHFDMANPKTAIIYKPGEDTWPISKSFFVAKAISRFHDHNIVIPDTSESWVIDHLTSETVETIQERNGGSYLRYSHMPGRKDDLLMALAFAEALVYSKNDPTNPRNKRIGAAF